VTAAEAVGVPDLGGSHRVEPVEAKPAFHFALDSGRPLPPLQKPFQRGNDLADGPRYHVIEYDDGNETEPLVFGHADVARGHAEGPGNEPRTDAQHFPLICHGLAQPRVHLVAPQRSDTILPEITPTRKHFLFDELAGFLDDFLKLSESRYAGTEPNLAVFTGRFLLLTGLHSATTKYERIFCSRRGYIPVF